jgi:tetratricopeptide (TPR) repeat protein
MSEYLCGQRRAGSLITALLSTARPIIALPCIALMSTACGTAATTQRVVGGRTLEGRYIAPEAYATVMRAELLAAQGLTTQAYRAYQEASDVADYSPSVWTRLGALACQLKLQDHAAAFAKAEARDPDYEPLWRARAECALSLDDPTTALRAAERATALDPNQPRNTELAAVALSRLSQQPSAAHWQHAFALRGLREAALATATNTSTADLRTGPVSSSTTSSTTSPKTSPVVEQQSNLDQALLDHDLPQARRHALRTRLDPSALALRALQLGLPEVALEQAQLVLSANPQDADARVAALCAADLLHDAARFQALLVPPLTSAPLRPAARAELSRLLARRTGLGDEDASTQSQGAATTP